MPENEFEVQRSLGRIEGGITRLETEISLLRTDHSELRGEFNKLEAGRLTRLESEFATQKVVMHSKSKNTAIIYSMISAILTSVATAAVLHFLNL